MTGDRGYFPQWEDPNCVRVERMRLGRERGAVWTRRKHWWQLPEWEMRVVDATEAEAIASLKERHRLLAEILQPKTQPVHELWPATQMERTWPWLEERTRQIRNELEQHYFGKDKGMSDNMDEPNRKDEELDFTQPVQTRDGRKVRVLCTDGGGDYPVVGLYEWDGSHGTLCRWTLSGVYHPSGESNVDLEQAPPELVKRWVNIYKHPFDGYIASFILHETPNERPHDCIELGWEFLKAVEVELPPFVSAFKPYPGPAPWPVNPAPTYEELVEEGARQQQATKTKEKLAAEVLGRIGRNANIEEAAPRPEESYPSTPLVEKLVREMRDECLQIFGSAWSYGNANRLAVRALSCVRAHDAADRAAEAVFGKSTTEPDGAWLQSCLHPGSLEQVELDVDEVQIARGRLLLDIKDAEHWVLEAVRRNQTAERGREHLDKKLRDAWAALYEFNKEQGSKQRADILNKAFNPEPLVP